MAITVAMRTQVSQLYVALFGRAPDGEGLGFWVGKLDTGGSLASVAQEMYNTTPARVFYPTFLTNEEIVGRFYTNVLGRTADAEGLAFWTGKLNAKGATPGSVISEMISVVQNYKGTDPAGVTSAALFNNKVSVAQAYGEANKDAAGATTAIATVTADPATVTAAIAAINAPAPVPSTTFTLTTGVDTGTSFTGGAGNDTFNSTNSSTSTTLSAGDSLTGGTGTDTLNVTTTAAATLGAGVTTAGIENVVLTATGGALSLNAAGFSGVTSVSAIGSTEAVTVDGLSAIPTSISATGTNKNLTVNFAAAAVTGTADATTVNVNGVATTADTTITVNGIENITLNSTGSASGSTNSSVILLGDSIRSVTLTGTVSDKAAVTLSGATGTIAGTVTGGSGADDIAITAGSSGAVSANLDAGDDILRLTSVAATMTIAGGAGNDTLVFTGTTGSTTTTANITGIENVSFPSATPPTAFGLTGATNVTYAEVASGVSFAGLASGGAVNLQKGGSITLTNTAWTGAADAVTVNLGTSGASGTSALTSQSVTTTGVETVTVNTFNASTVSATSTNSLTVSGDTLSTIVVTSPIGATLAGGGTALRTIDASGVTGAFRSTATLSTGGVTITGGAGADTLVGAAGNDVINGGSGADSIDGGIGADTLTGGAGADIFVIRANTTTESYSTGSLTDVIEGFVSGSDRLQISQTNNSFLGNVANVTVGLGAMTGNDQSFFVTSENTLYVVATQGRLTSTDTIVKLTGVTGLVAADVSVGSNAGGVAVVPATASTVRTATAVTTDNTDGTTGNAASAFTGANDTLRVYSTDQQGFLTTSTSALSGGNGLDTIEIYGLGTSNASLTLDDGVTSFEAIRLLPSATATTQTGTISVTLNDANVAANLSTPFSISTTVSTAGVTINASSVTSSTTSVKNLSITGGSFVSGGDVLTGGGGNDTIDGGIGDDTITGGAGNDVLTGGAGNDSIIGASGNDSIDAGAGNDVVYLGGGAYGASGATASIELGSGTNTLQLADTANLTWASVLATGGTYSLELVSGAGVTIPMALFSGSQSAVTGGGTETITFSTSGTVDVSTLGANIERFVLATGGSTITVHSGVTSVAGGAGADTLRVAAGDAVAVLAGSDTISGGSGTATDTISITGTAASNVTLGSAVTAWEAISYAATTGTTTLQLASANIGSTMAVTAIAGTTLTFVGSGVTGTATLSVTSGTGDDTITVGSGADTVTSGDGNDSITGGNGADVLNAMGGNDTINGDAGNDVIDGDTGNDYLFGGSGVDTITGGAGIDYVTGGEGADVIYLGAQTDATSNANAAADHLVVAAASDVGTIIGVSGATNGTVLSVSGTDIVFGFNSAAFIDLPSLSLNTTILRNGDTIGDARQAMIRGNYNSADGTFTISLTGTSTLYVFDGNTTGSDVTLKGIVLVGYVDAAANDTGGATGLTGVGG